jgi:hypothetical protein
VRLCRLAEIPRVLVRFLDGVLLTEAEVALRRLAGASAANNSVAAAGAAFTAIVTAAGTIEACLSEVMAHLEEVGVIKPEEREELKAERHLWKKWNRLAQIFGAEPTELSGTDQYRALIALVKLRNVLVHRSAEFLPLNEWPEELNDVRALIPHVVGAELDWTSQVLVQETADWAVTSAKAFLKLADEYVLDPARMPGSEQGGA